MDEIRAALDAHDEVARVAEALHDEWGYAALRLSADMDDVEARDLATASCRCWSASAPSAGRWRRATASCRTRPSPIPAWRRTATTSTAAATSARSSLDPLAERAFAARGDAASTAWRRLYDDTMTAVSVPFDAGDGVEPHSLTDLRALLWHRDRDVRLRAVAAAARPAPTWRRRPPPAWTP